MKKQEASWATPILLAFLALAIFLFPTESSAATYERAPEVQILNPTTRSVESSFRFAEDSTNASMVTCNLSGDAQEEIVIGSGANGKTRVKIYRSNGSLIKEFSAYNLLDPFPIHVACGDFNGDGFNSIVTAPAVDAPPHVKIFDAYGQLQNELFVFDPFYHGGVNVAVGNVMGDKRDELIVGVGNNAEPYVKILDGESLAVLGELNPFSVQEKVGVAVATANVDGGTEDELVLTLSGRGRSWVKVYKMDANKTVLGFFEALEERLETGLRATGMDLNHDGIDELAVTPRFGDTSSVLFFYAHGEKASDTLGVYEPDFRGGLTIASGDVDGDNQDELLALPLTRLPETTQTGRAIQVDLSEQRLYAYEDGYLLWSFLVSTGLPGFDTPTGDFKVLRKDPVKLYQWSYGANSPLNYSIPNVKYNLNFHGHLYLHHAYWHEDFGKRKSHGCINMDLDNSKRIYDWAQLEDPVTVVP